MSAPFFSVAQSLGQRPQARTAWDPAHKAPGVTLSDGDKTATTPDSGAATVRANAGAATGKHYWEVTIGISAYGMVGVLGSSDVAATMPFPGFTAGSFGYYGSNGQKYNNNTSTNYGSTYGVGDVISVLLDLDAGQLTFWKNGVSQGMAYSGLSGIFYPAFGDGGAGVIGRGTINGGARPFIYQPPAGY